MKKKIKLSLSSSLLSLFPISAMMISADAMTNENNKPNNENDEPKTVSPEFDEFKDEVKKIINEKLTDILDKKIEDIREKADLYLKASNEVSSDGKQDIVNSIYLRHVASYLEKNKNNILANPEKYGFKIVYPKVISENKELIRGTVTFDSETYDISFGTAEGTGYNSAEFKHENENERTTEINSFNLDKVKLDTESYLDDLNLEFDDI
ncbi:UNVERIFIED_CONTAM: hypothetical protein O8I53_13300 [Campylobacter lari]